MGFWGKNLLGRKGSLLLPRDGGLPGVSMDMEEV